MLVKPFAQKGEELRVVGVFTTLKVKYIVNYVHAVLQFKAWWENVWSAALWPMVLKYPLLKSCTYDSSLHPLPCHNPVRHHRARRWEYIALSGPHNWTQSLCTFSYLQVVLGIITFYVGKRLYNTSFIPKFRNSLQKCNNKNFQYTSKVVHSKHLTLLRFQCTMVNKNTNKKIKC